MGSREHNFYNAAYRRAGYEDVAVRVQQLWLDGKRGEAVALVPDELVLHTNLLGTDDMVRERIRAYQAAGVTTLRVEPEGRDLPERLATLGRVVDLVGEVSAERAGARL
jgi:alkanesulfonate monooxygenase SsuD/methylene tetrahydromethanopterin reductase-like flavin-dependent oxidoreductase (luciferase family)